MNITVRPHLLTVHQLGLGLLLLVLLPLLHLLFLILPDVLLQLQGFLPFGLPGCRLVLGNVSQLAFQHGAGRSLLGEDTLLCLGFLLVRHVILQYMKRH